MPRIREYTSSDRRLLPDERGFAAFETAGRRIGPLYNQAAADVTRSANSIAAAQFQNAELAKQSAAIQMLPWQVARVGIDIAAQDQAEARRGSGGGGGGGGSRKPKGSGQQDPYASRQVSAGAPVIAAVADHIVNPKRATPQYGGYAAQENTAYADAQRRGLMDMGSPALDILGDYAAGLPAPAKGTYIPGTQYPPGDLEDVPQGVTDINTPGLGLFGGAQVEEKLFNYPTTTEFQPASYTDWSAIFNSVFGWTDFNAAPTDNSGTGQ